MGNSVLRRVAGMAMLAAVALAGCSMPTTPAPAAPANEPSSATGESTAGELVVYTARSESLFKPVIEAFNQRYPDIKVTMLTGSNGELAAKLLEERANPQADLLVNSDTLTMESLAAEGLFTPNDSPAVAAVPKAYRAEDGNWVALTLRPRVIMYNTDLVQPAELPASVLELTDPKWKGQVGAADSRNGAMVAHLVAMRHLQGEEKMTAFVDGLIENDTQWFGGHTDVRKAVGAGELALGLVNHYYYHLSKAEGAPVGIIYPDQGEDGVGLIVNTTNAGIIDGGPACGPGPALHRFHAVARRSKGLRRPELRVPGDAGCGDGGGCAAAEQLQTRRRDAQDHVGRT